MVDADDSPIHTNALHVTRAPGETVISALCHRHHTDNTDVVIQAFKWTALDLTVPLHNLWLVLRRKQIYYLSIN